MNTQSDGVHHFPGGRRFRWRFLVKELEIWGKSPTHRP